MKSLRQKAMSDIDLGQDMKISLRKRNDKLP